MFKPKIHNSKQRQQRLCALLGGPAPSSSLDSDLGESDGSSDSEGNEFQDNGPSGDAQNKYEYPMLSKLGVSLDLSIGANESYMKDLIGECLSLQSAHDRTRKATNEC